MYNIELHNKTTGRRLKLYPREMGGDGFSVTSHDILGVSSVADDQKFLERDGGIFGIRNLDFHDFSIDFFVQAAGGQSWTELNNMIKRVAQVGPTLFLYWASEPSGGVDRCMEVRLAGMGLPSEHVGARAFVGRFDLVAAKPYWETLATETVLVSARAGTRIQQPGTGMNFSADFPVQASRPRFPFRNFSFRGLRQIPPLVHNSGSLRVLPTLAFDLTRSTLGSTNDMIVRATSPLGVETVMRFRDTASDRFDEVVVFDQEAQTFRKADGTNVFTSWLAPRNELWLEPGVTRVEVFSIPQANRTGVGEQDGVFDMDDGLLVSWRSRFN